MKKYKTYQDTELFLLAKDGDQLAFAEVYERYWEVLFRHALRMTKDKALAEDIVQEVFIALWNRIEQTDLTFIVGSYLYTMVRNKFLNLVQHQSVCDNYLMSLADFLANGESVTDYRCRENQLKTKIEQEVAQLPSKMRTVFELSRKENKTHKEIAVLLKISDKTVKKQVSNAVKILRLKLGSIISISYIVFSFLAEITL